MKRKTEILLLIVVLIVIAGLLDLKFEGLIYQLLPKSIQSVVTNIFN